MRLLENTVLGCESHTACLAREARPERWRVSDQNVPFSPGQKSNCALIFANRAVITDVGVSHGPFAMNAWL
jgi:hypothetical protein